MSLCKTDRHVDKGELTILISRADYWLDAVRFMSKGKSSKVAEAIIVIILGIIGGIVLALILALLFPKYNCPACGAEVKKSSNLCPKCGISLKRG